MHPFFPCSVLRLNIQSRNPGDGPERGIAASMASPLGGTGTTEVAGEIVPREEQPEAPQAAAAAKDKV